MEENSIKKEYRQNLILGLESLSVFLISFYLLYIVSGLSVLYISWDFDIPATLFLNHIHFQVPDHSKLWTTDAIISILMATPVSSFIAGIAAVFIFLIFPKKSRILLYFSLWIFLQAFNTTFGLLSENILSQTGLVRVAREMKLETAMLFLTVAMSIFFMIKSGQLAGKLFFSHLEGIGKMTASERYFKACIFFLFPWLAGSILILFISEQAIKSRETILITFMLFLLLPAVFTKIPVRQTPIISGRQFNWLLPLTSVAFILTTYSILRNGFSF